MDLAWIPYLQTFFTDNNKTKMGLWIGVVITLSITAFLGVVSLYKNEKFAKDPWFFPLLAALILSAVQLK
jgi:uncharacterized membrane protein YjjP (DUF1212 family)